MIRDSHLEEPRALPATAEQALPLRATESEDRPVREERAALAALGCLVDSAGALLAIRSKELFSYEEISAQHQAVASNTQSL